MTSWLKNKSKTSFREDSEERKLGSIRIVKTAQVIKKGNGLMRNFSVVFLSYLPQYPFNRTVYCHV